MEKIRTKYWRGIVAYPSWYKKIKFSFRDDNNVTDTHYGAGWSWEFENQKTFNAKYERNLVNRRYIELPPDNQVEWKVSLDNGVYDTSIILEKIQKEGVNSVSINGKTYGIGNEYENILQIHDTIIVSDKKISLKNNGTYPLRVYGVFIDSDKAHIPDIISPYSFEAKEGFAKTIVSEELINVLESKIYEINFRINKSGDDKKKYELVFGASSVNNDLLYVSTNDNFDVSNIVGVVKLDKDFKKYAIDITEYVKLMDSGDNEFKIFVKSKNGTRLCSDKNELFKFGISVLTYIDENFQPYKAKGYIVNESGKYIFKEQSTNVSYQCYSYNYELAKYQDQLLVVTGYVKDNQLNIVKVFSALDVTSITGDTYSNKEYFEWNVSSTQVFDGLRYRVKGVFELKEVVGSKILAKIPADGEYVIEVVPVKNGVAGLPGSLRFIVDRTGANVTGFEKLPDYTASITQNLVVEYSDNYTKKENIKLYKEVNGVKEEIFANNGSVNFTLPEGQNQY